MGAPLSSARCWKGKWESLLHICCTGENLFLCAHWAWKGWCSHGLMCCCCFFFVRFSYISRVSYVQTIWLRGFSASVLSCAWRSLIGPWEITWVYIYLAQLTGVVSGQSFCSRAVSLSCITSMCSVQRFPGGHSLGLAFWSFFYPHPFSFIFPLTDQAPVVQKLDSAIRWINLYSVDNTIRFSSTYVLDSDLSGG